MLRSENPQSLRDSPLDKGAWFATVQGTIDNIAKGDKLEKQARNYNVALYARLSKDDDNTGESSSITNQKKMLMAYSIEQGFVNYRYYIDDGYSGTNFDRPEFKQMIEDIEAR